MDAEDFKDIPKKYSQTYFQYKVKGEKDWKTLYAEEIVIKENTIHVRMTKGWISSQEYEFNFNFPPVGVLNFENTVVITNKYPARQWKKAATSENFHVDCPLDSLFKEMYRYTSPKGLHRSFKWGVQGVYSLFNNKYYSLKEALILMNKGVRVAAAVSPEFFVTNSHYNDTILLWRYNIIVAEIGKEINYLVPLFEQEVRDFLRNNNYA